MGRIITMLDHRYTRSRRALEEGEEGKKKRGRPKKKWLEAVMADLFTI